MIFSLPLGGSAAGEEGGQGGRQLDVELWLEPSTAATTAGTAGAAAAAAVDAAAVQVEGAGGSLAGGTGAAGVGPGGSARLTAGLLRQFVESI